MNPGHDQPVRLKPGCHLFAGADGTWRIYGPSDRFARIGGPPEVVASVARLLAGAPIHPSIGALPPGGDQLLAALWSRDVLEPDPAQPDRDPELPAAAVAVVGENPIADAVRALVAPRAKVEALSPDADAAASPADVLVWCAGPLPDVTWQEVDRQRSGQGLAWHMSYLEAGRAYLGPFSIPERTASYRDTRRRRLAAAAAPDELRQLWRHLDEAPSPRGAAWPAAPVAAVIAGFLAADVLAHLAGDAIPSAGAQVEVDLASLSVHRHPVLPVPILVDAAQLQGVEG